MPLPESRNGGSAMSKTETVRQLTAAATAQRLEGIASPDRERAAGQGPERGGVGRDAWSRWPKRWRA